MHPILPFLMTTLMWASTPTFGLLTLIWKTENWFNVGLRFWFGVLTVLGLACLFKTYLA